MSFELIAGPGPGGIPVSDDGLSKNRKLTHELISSIHVGAGNEDDRCDFLISMCKEPSSEDIFKSCTDNKEIIKECLFGPPAEEKRESLYEGDPNAVLFQKNDFDGRVSVTRDDYVKNFIETYKKLPKHTKSLFFMLEVQRRPRLWKILPILFYPYYLQTYEAKTESEIKSIAQKDFTCTYNHFLAHINPHLENARWRKTRVCLLAARAMKKVILGYYIKLQEKPEIRFNNHKGDIELVFTEKITTSAEEAEDDDDDDFGKIYVSFSLADDDYSFTNIRINHFFGMHDLSKDNNNSPVNDAADKTMLDTHVAEDYDPIPFKIKNIDEDRSWPYVVMEWEVEKKATIDTFEIITCFDATKEKEKISVTNFIIYTTDDNGFPLTIEVDISKIENFNDIRAVKLEKRLAEHLRSTVAPLSLARSMDRW